ncbi:MAG: hypothetical protein DDG60_02200 [Anaerolineae bacterium]|nr:MAG: hypothetical protein DDG60_02200 [Anaerolineae bacterium]
MPFRKILFSVWSVFALFLFSSCKFMQVMESLAPIGTTPTLASVLPSETPAPTLTPTLFPTATLDRGIQNPQNKHWYLLIRQERSFRTAQEYCRGMGAYLVTIADEAENRFVYELSPVTWLGATDESAEGQWVWVTGEPFNYTPWAEGEPNNCGLPDCASESYLTFHETPLKWSDVAAQELPFICEWDE